MNKPSLYRRCREAFNRFAVSVIYAPRTIHQRFDGERAKDPTKSWRMDDTYTIVRTCHRLGQEVLLEVGDDGHMRVISRPRRPDALPEMARSLPPPDKFRRGGEA